MLTINQHKVKCLIDTGSATSIIQPNMLNSLHVQTLQKPLYFSTINGINQICQEVISPIPLEFKISGTFSWKIVNFTGRKYDAIIGQNLLVPLKARINLEDDYLEINGNKIPFERTDYPFKLSEICSLEYDNLQPLKLDHMNVEEKDKISKLLCQYRKLFYMEGDILTSTHEIQHEIITTTNNPVYSKIYRYPQIHEKEIEKQIKEMLELGIIKNSNSPYNSPLWIVPKKLDNSGKQKWRIVIDYRKINEITVNDKFPIPNIDGILDKLGRAQYFTTLDLAKGFHQILVKQADREKTAFSTPFGHYEYIRMPFGLKNSPSTFQRLMNSVLRDLINKICVVYLDDILIFSTSLQEHIDSIRQVFNRLEKAGLKIQVDKCNFLKKETEYLGHILTSEGVKPNPLKIKTIQSLIIPTTQKQIKSFLGITGFYRKFIKDYAKVAHPMTKYLKKDMKVNTNDPNYIAAFEKLKLIITDHPILKYPDYNKKFKITTDASNFALGAVLSQEGHPICYASRTLNVHEKNYSTIEKEFLAIVWATKYFRPYVFGKEFDLQTDHQPLKWLHTKHIGKDINPRLQRWLISLGEYNIKIDYIKGKDNRVADFLSRINVDTNEINVVEKNREDSNNLGNENDSIEMNTAHSQEENLNDHFPILETVVNRFRTQIILKENKEKEYEKSFNNVRIFIDKEDLKNGNIIKLVKKYISKGKIGIYSELNDHEYNKLQQILIRSLSNNNQIKFLKCTLYAVDIEDENNLKKQIALFHKLETGHAGIIPTYEGLKRKIYNPGLKTTIHKIINNCDICTSSKYDRNPIKIKFKLSETPSTINQIIHVDIYVNSKHSFIFFIDKFSKHTVGFYLEDRNNQTIIEKLRQFLSLKGKIGKFIFDNEFNSKNLREFLLEEKIEYHITKPNSHTGNSDIERLNNTITERIRALNLEEKLPIKEQIFKALKFYNNTYHSTIKSKPIEVQEHSINYEVIKSRLIDSKEKMLGKRNKTRENYEEKRIEGYIKNYKSVRHKEVPKFRKLKLKNVHENNIKRSLKFSDDTLIDPVLPIHSANNGDRKT